jgi:hypothetical protein
MNEELDKFEQRLSRQPLRPIPPDWRTEILAAARASRPAPRAWLSALYPQLSTVFWPHPKAWAGLAAVWILIFALHFSMRDPSSRIAEKSAPLSPEMLVELKKQQRMFAELVGVNEPLDANRRKIFLPRPRSEHCEILAT